MSHWNYRVIRHENDGEVWFGLHECFYNPLDDKIPENWTANAVEVSAESTGGIITVLGNMMQALAKPILQEEGDKLVPWVNPDD